MFCRIKYDGSPVNYFVFIIYILTLKIQIKIHKYRSTNYNLEYSSSLSTTSCIQAIDLPIK